MTTTNATLPSNQIKPTTWLSGLAIQPLSALITLFVGVSLWMMPIPNGLSLEAWHLFAIFLATITGVILTPLPIAPMVMIGMTTALLTDSAPFEGLFRGYSQPTIWLIVLSFFMARGFISTGLANRAACLFVSILGQRTLGLAYGLILAELVLSPFIPSLIARSAGILFPLVLAVAQGHDDGVEGSPGRRTARFLLITVFQGSVICSGMFLTSMAANPLAVQMAGELGIEITWGSWALATFVPGMVSLLTVPWVIYKLIPPGKKETPEAPILARKQLSEMGSLSGHEKTMIGVFGIVLTLWLGGSSFGVSSVAAVMIGLILLLASGVISWDQCLQEKGAWNTLFWLGGLIGMGSELKRLGLFDWMGDQFITLDGGSPMGNRLSLLVLTLLLLSLLLCQQYGSCDGDVFCFLGHRCADWNSAHARRNDASYLE